MAKASIVGAKTPRAEAKTAGVEKWTDCYGGGRGDLFTPESNRHPAKMAVALCYRIFEHGRKRGYWKPGDVILDPMAGIGTTLVVGMSLGYSVVGVELEEHFVKLAVENLRHAGAKIGGENLKGSFRLVWGDARRLSEILNLSSGMAHAAVTSPPYTSEFREQHPGTKGGAIAHEAQRGGSFRGYSGVVTSPPYGDQVPSEPIAAWVLKVATEQGMPEAVRRYRAEVMDKLPKHGRWSDENIQAHIEAARRIREDGHYSGAISSPPYANQDLTGAGNFRSVGRPNRPSASANPHEGYSGVVTSPPYGEALQSESGIDVEKIKRPGGPNSQSRLPSNYSGAISSPPYSETHVGNPGEQELAAPGRAKEIGTSATGHGGKGRHGFQYSHDASAQIGNLRDPRNDIDAVLSSPPYGDTDTNTFAMANQGKRFDRLTSEQLEERNKSVSFGRHGYRSAVSKRMAEEGQIGCLSDKGDGPETYLGAMLAVYRELHAGLKPGGVVCLVTKNPVKAGKIRRLDEDTIRLMEAVGFELIERVQALLVEELGTQPALPSWGEHLESVADELDQCWRSGRSSKGRKLSGKRRYEISLAATAMRLKAMSDGKIQRERKSFFKRLLERKRPDLKVDYEDVLFFRMI